MKVTAAELLKQIDIYLTSELLDAQFEYTNGYQDLRVIKGKINEIRKIGSYINYLKKQIK